MAITPTDAEIEKWYVMTAYKFELKAEKSLREAGIDVYLPKETSYIKKPRRRPIAVERPAISSLIFVHASWNQIIEFKRKVDDRLKFKMDQLQSSPLSTSEKNYLTVPDAQMATFISIWATRDTLQASLVPILAPHPSTQTTVQTATTSSRPTLPIGTPVEITNGPLTGTRATTLTPITPRSRTTRISLPLASLLSITLSIPTSSLAPRELE